MSQIDQAFIKAYRQQVAGKHSPAPGSSPLTTQTLAGGAQFRIDQAHAESDAAGTPPGAMRVPTPHLQVPVGNQSWLSNSEPATRDADPAPAVKHPINQPVANEHAAAHIAFQKSAAKVTPPAPPAAGWTPSPRFGRRFSQPPVQPPQPTEPANLPAANAKRFANIEETLLGLVGLAMNDGAQPDQLIECVLPGIATEEPCENSAETVAQSLDPAPVATPEAETVASQSPAIDELMADAGDPALCPTASDQVASSCESVEDTVADDSSAKVESSSCDKPRVEDQSAPQRDVATSAEPIAFNTTPKESVVEKHVMEESVADPAAETETPVAKSVETPEIETPVESFQAAWEVDKFQWPDVIDRLRRDPLAGIESACRTIRDSVGRGSKLLAITGVDEDVGATTLSLTLARGLAKQGLNVALVDADFNHPMLAERLGVRVQDGWEATLDGKLPLEEVCVSSLGDVVTLVPLVQRADVSATNASLAAAGVLQQLTGRFDIVIIDAGSGSENVAAVATTSDEVLDVAVLLAVDERKRHPEQASEIIGHLQQCAISSIQIAQTFVAV